MSQFAQGKSTLTGYIVYAGERQRTEYRHACIRRRTLRWRARQVLTERTEWINAHGGHVEDTHVAVGRPDAEIVELAEELRAGLIVVGSRGLGGVRRALIGSVSDSVVRHAHSAVLMARSEEGSEPGEAL